MAKPNMADLFKQAQKLQEDLARAQDAIGEMTAEGTAGGGIVSVTVNGKQKILSVKIDPEVFESKDAEMLEDLVTAAANQAIERSQEMAKEALGKAGGGLLGMMPGGLKLPGLGF
jgi:DNA-binding YbaB/EbfC family protein